MSPIKDDIKDKKDIKDNGVFVIVKNDVNTYDSEILYVSDEYSDALLAFQEFYKKFINTEYIVREEKHLNNFFVYRRKFGWIYNSKELVYVFKLLGWSGDEDHKYN